MGKLNISEEELEQLNYNDVANLILTNKGKKMKLVDLYKGVIKTLNLEDDAMEHITDFFELLSTDKRFIMLDGGYWDLKIKHDKGMVITDDDEDEEEEELPIEEEQAEEDFDDEIDKDDDIEEDDLKDLVIIDENEEEIS